MTRVLIVAERAMPSRGGLAIATSRIAGHGLASGAQVHVVHLTRDAAPGGRGRLERDGVTMHPVGRLAGDEESLAALVDHASELAEQVQADVVHGIYATRAGYAAVVAAAVAGLPSVVSVRGNDVDRGMVRARDLPFLQQALTRATAVTAVSRALQRKVEAVFGRDVEYIPNAVDAERFRTETRDNSLVASLGLGDDTVIGFSGELREKKGMRFLLPAFAELSRRRPARLLLIGGIRYDGAEAFAEFKRLAPDAAQRVHVLEYSRSPKRLSRLLALCDVMVFPSLAEGMPNAVLEAMAAARPVLATAVGGHVDLIEHGRTGALLPLGELHLLPQAIAEMLDLPGDERAAIGARAREFIERAHRPDAEQRAYAQLYARLTTES